MEGSIEEIRKDLLVEWEADEAEPPEGKLFREQLVVAYGFLVDLVKRRMEKDKVSFTAEEEKMDAMVEKMIIEDPETAGAQLTNGKRSSKAPYIAVAVSRLVDFIVDLVSAE